MSAVWCGGVIADAYGYAAAFIGVGLVVASGAVALGAETRA